MPLLIPMILFMQAPAPPTPAVAPLLRAMYGWGYADRKNEGKGNLSILIDPATGRVVLELHGMGERLMLLQGDRASGYRVQIPRQNLDKSAPTLEGLPLPFLPALGTPEALYLLLSEGKGSGVKITKKDAIGPLKLAYEGKDEEGGEVFVWLQRKRWEPSVTKELPTR